MVLACSELKENDYQNFKDKVVIETEIQDLKLSEIPPFTDKIKIDEYEISLAKILPDNYENSDHLSGLITQFIGLGLDKERIGHLFGISDEPELGDIFQMFSEQIDILENTEQLQFVILYNRFIKDIDLKRFKVLTKGGGEYDLTYNFYIKQFNFLIDDASLDDRYKEVEKIFGKLPYKISDDNELLKTPYFNENNFVCPDLIQENLTDEQKLSLIDFLFNQWDKKNKKTVIKNIDWSKIGDIETENILGFNPTTSVYPSKYCIESEALPNYLIKWIKRDEGKIKFLTDLGVWTKDSVVVELRQFLNNKNKKFQNNRLTLENRFNDYETVLFNTFEWVKEKEIILKSEEQFKTFKKVVEVINNNRISGDLIIQEEYNLELLKENSTEWKAIENYTIYLYDKEMPKTIGLNEINNYVFYHYNGGNYTINESEIYLNSKEDKKKTLQKIASDDENDFTFENLWALYGESSNREQELEREIVRLKQQVSKADNATLGAEFSSDIAKNDQKEASREAKELVKKRLENEDFEFTKGINNYSTIDGVMKEGIEFPLVVKSYKFKDEPLKIGANEWRQLMKPNSMFWVNFGDGKLQCLKLSELLRNQDKLTISFSTENLDFENRLENFADILHYFKNVHFDFNSIRPDNYSTAENLNNYRFNERRTEEDLSSDDESLL